MFDVGAGHLLEPSLETESFSQSQTTFSLILDMVASQIAFSADGRLLAVGEVGRVSLWDPRTRTSTSLPLTAVGYQDYALAFGAKGEGDNLATGACLEFFNDHCLRSEIRLWDSRSRQPIGPALSEVAGAVTSLAFTSGGTLVVTSGGLVSAGGPWAPRP